MVMDAAKTHNSTPGPPPGGGWVEAEEEEEEEEEGKSRQDEGGGRFKRKRKRTTTMTMMTTNSDDLVPPDGGWGWVIVFANCINTSVLGSVMACYGVVFLPLVSIGYSNTQVATIPSIYLGLTCLLGPLATGLSHYYSARCLTVTGILLIVLAFILCSLSRSIVWFYACFGVLAGMGSALANPQGFLLGQKYFCRKRVTANGLSSVGGSLGIMVLPPLISYLVETYTLEGAFLLWAGLMLHGTVGAALYQPVEWHLRPRRAPSLDPLTLQKNKLINQVQSDHISTSKVVAVSGVKGENQMKNCDVFDDESVATKNNTHDNCKEDSDNSDCEEDSINTNTTTQSTQDAVSDKNDEQNNEDRHCDKTDNCDSERQWKNPLTDVLQTNEYLERRRTVSLERSMEILPQIPEESEDEDCFEVFDPESGNERVEFLNHENELRNRPISYISTKSVDSIVKIPSIESIFNSCDVLDQFGSALSFKVERLKDIEAEMERKKLKSSVSQHHYPLSPNIWCGLKIPRLQHLINFNILWHPLFLIMALSSIANRGVYMCMMAYLPSFGYELGLGGRAPYLLTIVATFELLGKVIMSIISDQGWLQRRYIYMMVTTTSAATVLCMTFAWDAATLGVCCGLYGFCIGTIMSIGPVLLVEYLGLKLLPHAYGLLLFLNGFAGFALFPFTGWLRDIAGDFIITFYVLGSLHLLPILLLSLVPCFPAAAYDASKTPDNV